MHLYYQLAGKDKPLIAKCKVKLLKTELEKENAALTITKETIGRENLVKSESCQEKTAKTINANPKAEMLPL